MDVENLSEVYEESISILLTQLRSLDLEPYAITSSFVQCLLPFSKWIEKGDPVLIFGEASSGKRALIDVVLKLAGISDSPIVEIHCNEATSPFAVLQKLREVYGTGTITTKGRVLQRRDRKRVILVIRSVDILK